jgi:hypothetical protein
MPFAIRVLSKVANMLPDNRVLAKRHRRGHADADTEVLSAPGTVSSSKDMGMLFLTRGDGEKSCEN